MYVNSYLVNFLINDDSLQPEDRKYSCMCIMPILMHNDYYCKSSVSGTMPATTKPASAITTVSTDSTVQHDDSDEKEEEEDRDSAAKIKTGKK